MSTRPSRVPILALPEIPERKWADRPVKASRHAGRWHARLRGCALTLSAGTAA
jgi:hypothetical protein